MRTSDPTTFYSFIHTQHISPTEEKAEKKEEEKNKAKKEKSDNANYENSNAPNRNHTNITTPIIQPTFSIQLGYPMHISIDIDRPCTRCLGNVVFNIDGLLPVDMHSCSVLGPGNVLRGLGVMVQPLDIMSRVGFCFQHEYHPR